MGRAASTASTLVVEGDLLAGIYCVLVLVEERERDPRTEGLMNWWSFSFPDIRYGGVLPPPTTEASFLIPSGVCVYPRLNGKDLLVPCQVQIQYRT